MVAPSTSLLCRALLACVVAAGAAEADVVIDLSVAAFTVNGSVTTEAGAAVTADGAAGPLLDDFDGDGVLELDADGDGLDRWDPEIRDYSVPPDGLRELPPDVAWPTRAGRVAFTNVTVPADVLLEATGPLDMAVAGDVLIEGVLRAAGSVAIGATGPIRVTGVARVAGDLALRTAAAGDVAQGVVGGGCVAPLVTKTPFPVFGPLGFAALLLALVGLGGWAATRRRGAHAAGVLP